MWVRLEKREAPVQDPEVLRNFQLRPQVGHRASRDHSCLPIDDRSQENPALGLISQYDRQHPAAHSSAGDEAGLEALELMRPL